MLLLDGLIIFLSGYLAKNRLSILNHVLILTLLPLASMAIMIAELKSVQLDFYGYLVIILLTGVSFLSVWVFPAWNGEYKKIELVMYFVTGIIVLIAMVLLALTEVLPNDIIESILGSLISKGNTYDIWSRPPYQLAHFVIMVGAFPYIAAFIISKIILKYKNYLEVKNEFRAKTG
jgi:intracellular septation protein A